MSGRVEAARLVDCLGHVDGGCPGQVRRAHRRHRSAVQHEMLVQQDGSCELHHCLDPPFDWKPTTSASHQNACRHFSTSSEIHSAVGRRYCGLCPKNMAEGHRWQAAALLRDTGQGGFRQVGSSVCRASFSNAIDISSPSFGAPSTYELYHVADGKSEQFHPQEICSVTFGTPVLPAISSTRLTTSPRIRAQERQSCPSCAVAHRKRGREQISQRKRGRPQVHHLGPPGSRYCSLECTV